MQYCLACCILFDYSAKFTCQNFAGASSVRYSYFPNVFVAVRTIIFCTSSPDATGWWKTNALFAFNVDAIVCFNTSISSSVIALLLPSLAIYRPDFWGVEHMTIKGRKRFYDDSSCYHFVVFDSAPVLWDPDEGSGSLTYESPTSTYSDQPSKKKAKRVRFLDDSGETGLWYMFEYPPWKDRNVECKDRGWTTEYVMRVWQEGIRESSDPKCVKEKDLRFSLGQGWAWDSFWFLNVVRVWYRKQALPEFPSSSFCWYLVGSVILPVLLQELIHWVCQVLLWCYLCSVLDSVASQGFVVCTEYWLSGFHITILARYCNGWLPSFWIAGSSWTWYTKSRPAWSSLPE